MDIRLRSGVEMPRLGLGVWQAGSETYDAVRWALDAGYRHIDTAAAYGNEGDVGRALADSGVPRDEVFVTTKLWNADHGAEEARRACEESLERLGLEAVDLYLIHWPVPQKRLDSWRTMEALREEGRCRAIGVSNFMPRHLDELIAETGVVPDVDQVELSPFLQQRELVERCARDDIAVEAYSPLTRGHRLDDPTVVAIARELDRTPAQVLIRWALQQGHVVIPKSTNRERIAENAAVFDFELSDAQMQRLDDLDEGARYCWDPTDVE